MIDMEKEDSIQARVVKLTHLYFRNTFCLLSETGIHPKQMPLLMQLSRKEGMSQKEISANLHISAPTVAVSMKRLEKSGLIERKSDEQDQRRIRIYLTERGRELIEKAQRQVEKSEKIIFKGFSESERCLMKRFFDQMIVNLEAENNLEGDSQQRRTLC